MSYIELQHEINQHEHIKRRLLGVVRPVEEIENIGATFVVFYKFEVVPHGSSMLYHQLLI